jgi:hypothetical protein
MKDKESFYSVGGYNKEKEKGANPILFHKGQEKEMTDQILWLLSCGYKEVFVNEINP